MLQFGPSSVFEVRLDVRETHRVKANISSHRSVQFFRSDQKWKRFGHFFSIQGNSDSSLELEKERVLSRVRGIAISMSNEDHSNQQYRTSPVGQSGRGSSFYFLHTVDWGTKAEALANESKAQTIDFIMVVAKVFFLLLAATDWGRIAVQPSSDTLRTRLECFHGSTGLAIFPKSYR
jgi:hypothetical protein